MYYGFTLLCITEADIKRNTEGIVKHSLKPEQISTKTIFKGVQSALELVIGIVSAFWLLIWNKFSFEHSFIGCFGVIEDISNNSEKYDFNSDVLRNCSSNRVVYSKCLEMRMRLFENIQRRI